MDATNKQAAGAAFDRRPQHWGTLIFVSPTLADTIHVPRDFATIQAAIDAAADLDEIIVAPGEYVETIDFSGKTIAVRSAGGRDVTTIDGNDAGSVVTCASGEGLGTVLDGFTITNGYAEEGGGMRNVNSSPTVTNCTFTDNYAVAGGNKRGGGVFNDNSVATFSGCTFLANAADQSGGGMFNLGSDVTILECAFVENQAWGDEGGGCSNDDSDVVFISSSFSANYASQDAGAMTNDGGSVIMDRCDFRDNEADYSTGGVRIYSGTLAVITNCLFVNNHADDELSLCGALCSSGATTIVNCTFADNSAFAQCNTMWIGSTTVLSNCIIDDEYFDPICGSGSISFSLVTDGWEGEGNISGDPMFVDRNNGDYRLSVGSPCIDAGNNNAVPKDVRVDLDGNPRIVDAPCTDDTGNGRPPIVDMGAFEFQPVEADCNGNGIPDECDIADGGSDDCNENGIPDECDIADGGSDDCNANGIPDECDIADGVSFAMKTVFPTNVNRSKTATTMVYSTPAMLPMGPAPTATTTASQTNATSLTVGARMTTATASQTNASRRSATSTVTVM